MRELFRTLRLAALIVTVCAIAAAAQEPVAPVSDPTLPSTLEPPPVDIPVPASLRQTPPPEPPERFTPLDELPPEEQLPAAPLLVSAYAFVVLALFGYLLSVAKRLGAVQREVDRLERDLKKSGRA